MVACNEYGIQRYPSDEGKKLLRLDEIVDFRENSIMPEFFEKSSLSGVKKHPDFQGQVDRGNFTLSPSENRT